MTTNDNECKQEVAVKKTLVTTSTSSALNLHSLQGKPSESEKPIHSPKRDNTGHAINSCTSQPDNDSNHLDTNLKVETTSRLDAAIETTPTQCQDLSFDSSVTTENSDLNMSTGEPEQSSRHILVNSKQHQTSQLTVSDVKL